MRLFPNLLKIILLLIVFSCDRKVSQLEKMDYKQSGKNIFHEESYLPKRKINEQPLFQYLTPNIYNFGTVTNDSLISKVFIFKNSGTYPLTVIDYYASCQCTNILIDKNYILPDDSARVTLFLSTKNKNGRTRITGKLITNTEMKYYKFVMEGDVISR
jgi:hypothetical protein